MNEFFFFGITILVSSILGAFTGFGFSLVAVPALALYQDPKMFVPVITVLCAGLNMILCLEGLKHVKIKPVLWLLGGGILGVPLGVYGLTRLSIAHLKAGIGVVSIIIAIVLLSGLSLKFRKERLATFVTGLISGCLQGSTTMSGPPVVLFGLNQSWEKLSFRATMVAYFLLLNLVTIVFFSGYHMFTPGVVKYSLLGLPGMLIGTWFGLRLKEKASQRVFEKSLLVVIMATGVLCLFSASR